MKKKIAIVYTPEPLATHSILLSILYENKITLDTIKLIPSFGLVGEAEFKNVTSVICCGITARHAVNRLGLDYYSMYSLEQISSDSEKKRFFTEVLLNELNSLPFSEAVESETSPGGDSETSRSSLETK